LIPGVSPSPGFSPGVAANKNNRALGLNLITMAKVRNWLHCVWGTKSRIPYLTREIKREVIEHIKANARLKGIYIDCINGHTEHIHCLISLHPDQALSDVIKLIKGETSFWINKNHLTRSRFAWAVEYYAASISQSHLQRVRNYIRNQEAHHRKKTWDQEFNDYLASYGFDEHQG
jgi:putative transposase